MSTTVEKMQFAYVMGKYSNLSVHDCQRLMRYAGTHIRIETELTNGYKTRSGEWDKVATERANVKRDRIDAKMEALANDGGCRIEYGALTVRVVFADGREAGIP
jgi:hypothetical protein